MKRRLHRTSGIAKSQKGCRNPLPIQIPVTKLLILFLIMRLCWDYIPTWGLIATGGHAFTTTMLPSQVYYGMGVPNRIPSAAEFLKPTSFRVH